MAHILVGKTITGLAIAEDRRALLFRTTDGHVEAQCFGDCCSVTWVEHIETPALGFPCRVVTVGELSMPDLGEMEGCDVVAYYGLKIVTDKGEIIIDYRNDSNGYYGGDLAFPGDIDFGDHGVYDQNQSNNVWKDLTEC